MTGRWRLVRAGTDAVPGSVRRLMAAARRGRGRRAWWTVLGVVAVVAALTGWVLWGSPLLVVREVQVTGVERLTPAEVHEAAAVPGRVPLLRVPTEEVAARVGELPPVREVAVHRLFPGTVRIDVVERTPVVAVPVEDGFRLVDADGVDFFTVTTRPGDLPGLVVADPGPDDPATRAGLTVLSALTPDLSAALETVVVDGPVEIRLELRDGRVVRWGDETQSQEKAQVATALLDLDVAVIDISAPDVVVTG